MTRSLWLRRRFNEDRDTELPLVLTETWFDSEEKVLRVIESVGSEHIEVHLKRRNLSVDILDCAS